VPIAPLDVLTILLDALILLPALILPRLAGALNALLLGEAEAHYLGFDIDRTKRLIVILTALITGAGVAVSGVIGFVGLVTPHLVRLAIGPDHRYLLPASALLGGCLLLLADMAARTVVLPAELPIGIVSVFAIEAVVVDHPKAAFALGGAVPPAATAAS
jgi:iron complex transport system permease protein